MYHIAQVNIAHMIAPLTDPLMADFVAQLNIVNAFADNSPGFVWRFQTAEGNATTFKKPFQAPDATNEVPSQLLSDCLV